ncbi:HECT-domain-containing protein [Saccharata proteae CBS 121410]|uniref:HECT-type E3 ubiquitin transferase n=1 Tax=Saccharata proteae CBS 121410 TaxID=1314787 RepID=A0A9P4M007_9PEZI|nr:HECT-domain-containing protein [Saccharata proteae CBS 121410]
MPSWGRQQHNRSASHPFPNIFGSKKKSAPNLNGDFSSTDEDKYLAYAAAGDMGPFMGGSSGGKKDTRDLEQSNCMTCDSKVKWPKGLKTFRCTACLTVNDLVPVPREKDEHPGTYPESTRTRRPMPLTVERTKAIVDRCLMTYLQTRCQSRNSNGNGPSQTPDARTPGHHGPPGALPIPNSNRAGPSPRPVISLSPPAIEDPDGMDFPGNQKRSAASTPVPRSKSLPHSNGQDPQPGRPDTVPSTIFKPLEDYMIASFGNHEYLNTAFPSSRSRTPVRTRSEGATDMTPCKIKSRPQMTPADAVPDFEDPRMLMVGDFAENGSWWTGHDEQHSSHQNIPIRGKPGSNTTKLVNSKSPLINWSEIQQWYETVLNAGNTWREKVQEVSNVDHPEEFLRELEEDIREARVHAQRTLLKVTENILKRPGRPLQEPEDIRFLLILLANPLLHPSSNRSFSRQAPRSRQASNPQRPTLGVPSGGPGSPVRSPSSTNRESGQHSGIIKRILGLLANLPNECHRYLTTWFSRFNEDQFRRMVDLVGKFVTHRLTRDRDSGRKRSNSGNPTAGLIPEYRTASGPTSAQLHAALGLSGSGRKSEEKAPQQVAYGDDWQLRAAAKIMSLLFAANNMYHSRKSDPVNLAPSVAGLPSAGLAASQRARAHGQLLPTSDFYSTLLDYHDLIADFEAWEKRQAKFAFCQYPFFLSIGAKIRIMEHDARRQMENKAREAFFDSILSNKSLEQYFHLKVRRDCLVDDSLRRISEVVGAGQEDIKKGLKVHFLGEEGIDAGGLRKEWFLLLVREVFDPMHGLFVYDEDSHFCYFNPNTFEASDQFFLVGAVLGLAIYNSTILDVALPPFAFKKLLAAAPAKNAAMSSASSRSQIHYTLEDLAEFRPALARGLRQLLDFDGDVEATFCRDFVAEVERYGTTQLVPLCPGGENKPVTNENRAEFVSLYVRYLLDGAVARQFDPFRRGFFTVCGGNALSLFRSEEIELLVRGSDEPLDVASVRAVAQYEGWKERERKVERPGETVPVLRWFWDFFESANPQDQRKILSFITGSDRIPAVGATNLVIKINCLGEDSDRYPVARTCFNMLQLYKYKSRAKLVEKLWRAVCESEGFGLK